MLASIRAASLVAALLARMDVGSWCPPAPLQPCDYASSSGDWVLHVDPSQRYGAGPARYRMTHGGVVAWERELAFTFRFARVTSDGNAIGYASTNGIPFQRREGDFVVAILAPDGGTRLEEHEAFVSPCLWCSEDPSPRSLDLVESDDRAVLIVQHSTEQGSSYLEAWEYRLSVGRPLGRKADEPGVSYNRPTRSKPAPPLKEFSSDGLAEVALVPIGETRFELPETVAAREVFRFWQIDSLGRVLFRAHESVAVFRRSGELLFIAQPDPVPPGRRKLSWPMWGAARGDGGLSLQYIDAAIDCGPDGRQVRCDWKDGLDEPERYYLPGSLEWWEIDNQGGRITRHDASGLTLHVIERDANQRWLFRTSRPVCVARDGSLAALDYHADSGPWLQIFDADARPVASTELRSSEAQSSRWTGLAFDGRRAALLRDDELVLVDDRGRPNARATLPATNPPDGLVFSPEGELWGFEGNVAQRYAVP